MPTHPSHPDGSPGRPADPPRRPLRPPGLEADVAELRQVAIRDRWGLGLMGIGWVHLATFLTSHFLYASGDLKAPRYLVLWAIEAIVVTVLIRRMVTNHGRHAPPPLVGVLARVWVTFILIGFSVASLNNLTGMPPEWFKPVWASLSTFGFAMMAWLVSLWFLVPAIQMSLTGMLMATSAPNEYLIYAISWWLALHVVGLAIERCRTPGDSRDDAATSDTDLDVEPRSMKAVRSL